MLSLLPALVRPECAVNLLPVSWLRTVPAATFLNELAPENSLMSIRTASLCLLLTSLALTAPISAQEDLRWKFQSGETLKYVVQQKMQTEMMLNGMTVNQKCNNRWTCRGKCRR